MRLGHKMTIDMNIGFQRRVFFSGQYDDFELAFVQKFLGTNIVILEIGANIGFYSCGYAQIFRGHNCQIHAFEAVSKTHQRLQHNVSANGFDASIKAYHIALGEKPGTLKMYITGEGDTSNAVGEMNIRQEDADDMANKKGTTENVEMTTLDLWQEKIKLSKCDFIKIDVEGAELFVFRGGHRLLDQFRPIIYGEFNTYWLQNVGLTFCDVMTFFDSFDYAYFWSRQRQFHEVTESFLDGGIDHGDYLLVPKEKVGLLAAGRVFRAPAAVE